MKDVEDWTYEDIFNAVMEDKSITMVIEKNMVEAVKKGIINHKQATRKRALYHKIPWEPISLVFYTSPCEDPKEAKIYTNLTVEIAKKATVAIRRVSTSTKFDNLEDE